MGGASGGQVHIKDSVVSILDLELLSLGEILEQIKNNAVKEPESSFLIIGHQVAPLKLDST